MFKFMKLLSNRIRLFQFHAFHSSYESIYLNNANKCVKINCCYTAVKTLNNIIFPRRNNCTVAIGFQPYSMSCRCFSSLIDLNSSKVDQVLRSVTSEHLKEKFNLREDEVPVVYDLVKEKEAIEENLKQLQVLKESEEKSKSEKEMLQLIKEDENKFKIELKDVYERLLDLLLPKADFQDCNDIVIEISAGVGGLEAMLFTSELRQMYLNFCENKGWECLIAENDGSELGGVRHCSLLVSGKGAYDILQHEAGVHRVQRVPSTERSGRMHTSTVSVAVLPQPSDIEVNIKEGDLKIETKRASGAGGQHVNTTDSAVRITHLPTKISVECQSGRSQHQNKTIAMARLRAKLYEQEFLQVDSSIRTQRKTQVGTSGRSEKIRTYNYRDDRISDHRLSINIHNMKEFLEGGESLDKLINLLKKWQYQHRLQRFINSLAT